MSFISRVINAVSNNLNKNRTIVFDTEDPNKFDINIWTEEGHVDYTVNGTREEAEAFAVMMRNSMKEKKGL